MLLGQEIPSVVIDLTSIGTGVTEEQWYLGQINCFVEQLKLQIDFERWWTDRAYLGEVQRYVNFFSEVILPSVTKPIVVFVDEIESTLELNYGDDYFAAIRSLYNQRAVEPIFRQLTFVLLGVTAPTDFIKNPSRTPFNIGKRIQLKDFSLKEARPLANGLNLGELLGVQVLEHILNWTGGHPYLTQKACAFLVENNQPKRIETNAESVVRDLIEEEFLSEKSFDDDNLRFVRQHILSNPNADQLLTLYYRVLSDEKVPDDEHSSTFTALKLSGIVKVKNRYLDIRNKIYREVFNQAWVHESLTDRSLPSRLLLDRSFQTKTRLNHVLQLESKSRSSIIKVFVSSPSDVKDARGVLEAVIKELNAIWSPKTGLMLQLLDWHENVTPWLGKPPEATLLLQLPVDTWDLFIGIMWSRFGTPTGNIDPITGKPYRSGTEEEFILAYRCNQQRGFPKLLFYRCAMPVNPQAVDLKQLGLVQEFFKQFEQEGLYSGYPTPYENLDDFRRQATRHLTTALMEIQEGHRPVTPVIGLTGGIKDWLEKVGLSGNPFRHWDASTDDNLPHYFHTMVPYFNELVGNSPDLPQSSMIFGARGVGKTAIAKMIAHDSKQKPGGRTVLCISYTDFSPLVEKAASGGSISPRDHVEQILRLGVQALGEVIQDRSDQLRAALTKENRLELLKYVHHFGQNLSQAQCKVVMDVVQVENEGLPKPNLPVSFVEMFYSFCRLIRVFGYDTIYVLMDQLEESSLAGNDDKIISLLVPLMAELKLMELPDGLATFRFFLPTRLEALLKKNRIRFDRLVPYRLSWTNKDLQMVIEQRLRFFSTNQSRPYKRLAELSTGIDNLDSRLIEAAQGNVRTLITLSNYLISEHCRIPITDDNIYLTQNDFDAALKRWQDDIINDDMVNEGIMPQVNALPVYSPIDLLPTPIAVLVVRYQNEQNTSQKLWKAFALTQIILQLVAGMLIILYKQYGQKDTELDEKLIQLVFNVEHPPSLGDWRQAIDRILKKKDAIKNRLVEPFVQFRSNKEVGRSVNNLIETRNAMAHGRLSIVETQKLREIDEQLEILLKALEPISHLGLLSVEDYDVNDAGQWTCHMWVHKGNVLVPQRQQFAFERPYPRGRVVLYDPESKVSTSLWPFVIFETPPDLVGMSGEREIYLYDQLIDPQHDGKTAVQYVNPLSGRTLRSFDPIQIFKEQGFI